MNTTNKTVPSDGEINTLRERYGITSNGRGIREFTQVVDFARAVLEAAKADKPDLAAMILRLTSEDKDGNIPHEPREALYLLRKAALSGDAPTSQPDEEAEDAALVQGLLDAVDAATPPVSEAAPEDFEPFTSKREFIGRLAPRRWQQGDLLAKVGELMLISGPHADVDSDQHRCFTWRKVIGYAEGTTFVCLQTAGCWPTVERLENCWVSEVRTLATPAQAAPRPLTEFEKGVLTRALKRSGKVVGVGVPVAQAAPSDMLESEAVQNWRYDPTVPLTRVQRALAWLYDEGHDRGAFPEDFEDRKWSAVSDAFNDIRAATPVAANKAEPVPSGYTAGTSTTGGRVVVQLCDGVSLPPGSPLFAAPPVQSAAPGEAARDVLAERERQKTAEGWTPEHDDEHENGELAHAAAAYAAGNPYIAWMSGGYVWPRGWEYKGRGARKRLVKAAALLIAEIERLDRAAIATSGRKEG